MKILLIVTQGTIGGAQQSVLLLAKGLKQKRINVLVGSGFGSFLKDSCKLNDIPYVQFNKLKRTNNPFKNIAFSKELKDFLSKNSDISTVHFNSSNALFGAWGIKRIDSRPKTVFTFRGLSFLDPDNKHSFLLRIFYKPIFKHLLRFIDEVVFVSKKNQDMAFKLKIAFKGKLIYNSADPNINYLSKEKARQELGISNIFTIGSIGRFAYPKNYEFLIRAIRGVVKKNPNIQLALIGDGPEIEKYKKLITKLNLKDQIHLIGAKINAAKYLKAFDLFVLPSLYEGMSVTLLESLQAQVPAIASNVGGNQEILGKKMVYPVSDQQSLVEKMLFCLNNPKKPSLKKIPDFDKLIDDYLSLYK